MLAKLSPELHDFDKGHIFLSLFTRFCLHMLAIWTFPSEPHGRLQQLCHAETMAEPKHRQIVDTSISWVHWKLFPQLSKTAKILLESHVSGMIMVHLLKGPLTTWGCDKALSFTHLYDPDWSGSATNGHFQSLETSKWCVTKGWDARDKRARKVIPVESFNWMWPSSSTKLTGCFCLPVCLLLKMRDDIRGGAW